MTPYYSLNYDHEKKLIEPYFDEIYYKKHYQAALEKTGESPIDHFLSRSCRRGEKNYNPNAWFPAAVYKYRLWPCSKNPFVDFLGQPKMDISSASPEVKIYANKNQALRAWLAIEGFLRKKKYQVILILPEEMKYSIPLCFRPFQERGLKIYFSKDKALSFYRSPFLYESKNDENSSLSLKKSLKSKGIEKRRSGSGQEYWAHLLYKYTDWKKQGIIDPCVLNFSFYCDEPMEFSPFGTKKKDFQNNLREISSGFDLIFLNSDIGVQNLKIIPGYMESWIKESEVPIKKEFGISFLLSLGAKGLTTYKTRGSFIYHFRKEIWDKEKHFILPTSFFISRRDIQKYPQDLQNRILPDESKKWLFKTQFTIAIENVRQDHYFSEKLIDCFIGLTVPIYIGCPNVEYYFDKRGMFIAENPNDVIRIANTLTPDTYARMMPYVLKNKKLAQKYLKLQETFIEDFFEDNMLSPLDVNFFE